MPTWKGNRGKSMTARAGRKQWNAGRTYAGPVEERPIGVDEKETNVRNGLSWGKFTAAFLLQCLAAIETTDLRL